MGHPCQGCPWCFPRIIPFWAKNGTQNVKGDFGGIQSHYWGKSPKYLKNAPRAQIDIILDKHSGIPLVRIPRHVGGYIAILGVLEPAYSLRAIGTIIQNRRVCG